MVDITLEYSRPFRALKLWLAFRAHGADAIRGAIERNLCQARLLRQELGGTTTWRRSAGRRSSRSCRSATCRTGVADLDEHNARARARVAGGRPRLIAPARVDGKVCLRPCIVNYRTTDDDVRALVELTRELGAALASGG